MTDLYTRELKDREIQFSPKGFPGKNSSWRKRKEKKKHNPNNLPLYVKNAQTKSKELNV